MKQILLIVFLLFAIMEGNAQNKNKMEELFIQKIIENYATALDAQNVPEAEKFLDKEFRVVLNNYNNSGTIAILSREQYTGMMRSGKVGGNKRKVKFLLTDIHDNAAVVKVQLEGEKNIFTNYYSLIKNGGTWLIINDMPQIIAKPVN
ncbi:nuclear transport factor 2 family protein [Flavihumibacter fluvii]|uniref:nuclear transport factor 2 family protein n=1 Tax=Flavihumibacter fluvii TaxID=2838157 RepID=UPI001BDDDE5D|nr:nuclear transport factor 2 family protein [Flavihumibacter fluvii]ULQ50952.1 nuclear transport factor 2 family protein [Flavihumibacter fluvii]